MGRPACCADLQKVCERIRHKEKDYLSYNFSQAQNILLRTFFDLSQEFESIEDFYRVCVAGPLECMGLTVSSIWPMKSGKRSIWSVPVGKGCCRPPGRLKLASV
ncbi:MAG: hypothetical protein OEV91_03420 [Desulfobulbaceae bacterium]|nr:hypothetical protein [Desulfobulbaceae bacterium]